MRRALIPALLAPPIAAVVIGACDPLFGIVTRTAGPTWCEEDAQAIASNGFCDDFDRGDASPTTSMNLSAAVNATVGVTSEVSSSAPNSLGVSSVSIQAGSGVLAGSLISFGSSVMPGTPLSSFTCQADFYTDDVATLTQSGVTVGLMGVGGQAASCHGRPILAMVGFKSVGLTLSLEELAGPTVPATPVGAAVVEEVPPGVLGGGWKTLRITVTPSTADAGASVPTLGDDDAGVSQLQGCDDVGPMSAGYIVVAEIGGIYSSPLKLPDLGFVVSMMAYGEFMGGPAPASVVHLDNVRCASSSP